MTWKYNYLFKVFKLFYFYFYIVPQAHHLFCFFPGKAYGDNYALLFYTILVWKR